MSDTDPDIESGNLMLALGHAILQWASVEFHLSLLFRTIFANDPDTADLFWHRVRSFEAKMLLMHDLALARLSEERRRDWNLLRSRTMALYGKRNRLAHSTKITHKGRAALEPFFILSKPTTAVLFKSDVDGYADEFMELSAAVLNFNFGEMASQRQRQPEPESDLLRRLRSEDDQKREVLRHRDLAWRQYLERNPDLNLQ
jgi:hypothetical protein